MENSGKIENAGSELSTAAERKVVFADAGPEVDLMFSGERRRRIEDLGEFSIHYGDPEGAGDYLQRVRQAHAIMIGGPASFPSEALRRAEDLEVISFTGRGVATYVDLDVAAAQGVTVCISPGAAESTVAEHAGGADAGLRPPHPPTRPRRARRRLESRPFPPSSCRARTWAFWAAARSPSTLPSWRGGWA